MEVMYATSTIKACIVDGHLDEIEQHIEKGRDEYQHANHGPAFDPVCNRKS